MPAPDLRYDLLAVDLDGTLFDPAGRITPRTADAVRRARGAGIEVVVCTGRGMAESAASLAPLAPIGPVIVAGGAMTVDAATGRTLHRSIMPHSLVTRLTRFLHAESRDHPVLLLKDRGSTDLDYLVVGDGLLDPVSEWWFAHLPVAVARVSSTDDDAFPNDTVRVGMVAPAPGMREIGAAVVSRFARETFVHHFPAMIVGERGPGDRGEEVHVLEIFNADTNKWSAVAALAAGRGIDAARIAAIGDEINDTAMIRHAGLGIAMANAIEPIRHIADRITLSNSDDGVAHAIEMILARQW